MRRESRISQRNPPVRLPRGRRTRPTAPERSVAPATLRPLARRSESRHGRWPRNASAGCRWSGEGIVDGGGDPALRRGDARTASRRAPGTRTTNWFQTQPSSGGGSRIGRSCRRWRYWLANPAPCGRPATPAAATSPAATPPAARRAESFRRCPRACSLWVGAVVAEPPEPRGQGRVVRSAPRRRRRSRPGSWTERTRAPLPRRLLRRPRRSPAPRPRSTGGRPPRRRREAGPAGRPGRRGGPATTALVREPSRATAASGSRFRVVGLDVGEHRSRPQTNDRLDRRKERVGRGDDLVARPEPLPPSAAPVSASVPDDTPTAVGKPAAPRPARARRRRTSGPRMNLPEASTRAAAARSRPRRAMRAGPRGREGNSLHRSLIAIFAHALLPRREIRPR